jgi:hypothetical protein
MERVENRTYRIREFARLAVVERLKSTAPETRMELQQRWKHLLRRSRRRRFLPRELGSEEKDQPGFQHRQRARLNGVSLPIQTGRILSARQPRELSVPWYR